MRSKPIANLITTGLIACSLSVFSMSVLADEISGTIDGETHQWFVLSEGDRSTANFTEFMPGLVSVSIQGYRAERFQTQGTINIEFMASQSADRNPTASVTYFHESGIFPHYGTVEDVPIEIEALELDGDRGRAKGSVSASLPYVESIQSEHDSGNTIEVDLTFDVTLIQSD